jgi:hypothetical protein
MLKRDRKRRRTELVRAAANEAFKAQSEGAACNVFLNMQSRDGTLVFRDGDRTASAYVEMSGVPEYVLLVWSSDMHVWSDGKAILPEERDRIMNAFKAWAQHERVSVEWSLP